MPAPFKWSDELRRVKPAPRRPLTLPELRRLSKLGFPDLAARLAAGTCPDCGLNRNGRGHYELCITAVEPKNPLPAPPEPHQPWQPRPSRFAA